MRSKFKSLMLLPLAVCTLFGTGLASAVVEVRFVDPANFSDLREVRTGDRERVLIALQGFLRVAAERELRGKDMLIEVTDVRLAGQIEYPGIDAHAYRVLRRVTWPSMRLRYTVTDRGITVAQGEAKLIDQLYLDHIDRHFSGDTLKYERRMIDDWFRYEFAAKLE